MSTTEIYLPAGHRNLIEIIAGLPEFDNRLLWRPEQIKYLSGINCRWKWIGARIDYLQRRQLGFIDPDPADQLSNPRLQKYLTIYSDYFFQMLQIVIAGFEAFQSAHKKKNTGFDFSNPREVFAAMCLEMSKVEVERVTRQHVGAGVTITQLREAQSLVGKFYRGSLPEREAEIFCEKIQNDGFCGFVIASIYQGFRAYLDKPSTSKIGRAHV